MYFIKFINVIMFKRKSPFEFHFCYKILLYRMLGLGENALIFQYQSVSNTICSFSHVLISSKLSSTSS